MTRKEKKQLAQERRNNLVAEITAVMVQASLMLQNWEAAFLAGDIWASDKIREKPQEKSMIMDAHRRVKHRILDGLNALENGSCEKQGSYDFLLAGVQEVEDNRTMEDLFEIFV